MARLEQIEINSTVKHLETLLKCHEMNVRMQTILIMGFIFFR